MNFFGKLAFGFALLMLCGNGWSSDVPMLNIRSQPSQHVILELSEMRPADAAERILDGLLENYQPARGAVRSSTAGPVFPQWLDLAVWFSLLAKTEEEMWSEFLSHQLRVEQGTDPPRILHRSPGVEWTPDYEQLPPELLRQIASDQISRKTFSAVYLPEAFVWEGTDAVGYLGADLARQIATNRERLQETVSVLSEQDFLPGVFSILRRLHEHNPEKMLEYYSLALALAVVFDQTPPTLWPHWQVNRDTVPLSDKPVEEWFDFWVASNEGRQLVQDLRGMGADSLRFVVDAPVEISELEWARRNVRTSRASFARVFSSINYDHDRIQNQQYSWLPDVPYTLEEIRKRGGICVDQAYFAMLAGKAKGIPTLYFVGQGTGGGHAWFGYLRGENRWDLDAGRYENQNYAVGQALDPQTWTPVTDHELHALSANLQRTPAWIASSADVEVAEFFAQREDFENAEAALKGALQQSPRHPDAWRKLSALLKKNNAPDQEVFEHYEKAAAAFQNDPDLRAEFLYGAAEAARRMGDVSKANELQAVIVQVNRRGRSDLSVSAAAGPVLELLESGDRDEALREFRRLCSRLGRSGGGNFFYEIVQPVVMQLIEQGDRRDASRALDTAKRQMRPDRGSILAEEFDKLEKQIQELSF